MIVVSQKRFAFFLPNTFTALNLGCGLACMTFSIQGDIYNACMILLLGAVFDSVDGRVARMTGTQSAFGEQFDSMSDVVSFGVAPALMVHIYFLQKLGRIGLVGSFLFLLCGALRLARFHTNIHKNDHGYFQGLPIPIAALGLAGFCLWSLLYDDLKNNVYLILGYTLILSFLMISNIPFPSLKNTPWVGRQRRATLFIMFLVITALFINEKVMVGTLVNFYIIFSMVSFILKRKDLAQALTWNEGDDGE